MTAPASRAFPAIEHRAPGTLWPSATNSRRHSKQQIRRTDPPADAMGVGERSKAAFIGFLTETLGAMASVCRDGAIAFVCLDWRHMAELLAAGDHAFTVLINLCVWNETESGVGTLYRAKHQLVFVYRTGAALDTHSFGLGAIGHHRPNVWDSPGVSGQSAERAEDAKGLARRPSLKPTALVVDAMCDCAAERCGRAARVLEADPFKCDVIIRRFAQVAGKPARLADAGLAFQAVAGRRNAEVAE